MDEFVELLRTEWPLKTVQRMRAVFFLRELSNTRANNVHECGKSRTINNNNWTYRLILASPLHHHQPHL